MSPEIPRGGHAHKTYDQIKSSGDRDAARLPLLYRFGAVISDQTYTMIFPVLRDMVFAVSKGSQLDVFFLERLGA